MGQTFIHRFTLAISFLLVFSLFSCQQEKIIPSDKFEKKLAGTWEAGAILSPVPSEEVFFTDIVFDEDGFFKARNGTAIAKSGAYTVSEIESTEEDQVLMLVTEDRELITYIIEGYTGKKMKLIPLPENDLGHIFSYEKK